MSREMLKVIAVIDIVNYNFVVVSLLEVIWNIETLDPLWVQVVPDDLSSANLAPHVPLLLVEDHHAICVGEGVQVGEVRSGK